MSWKHDMSLRDLDEDQTLDCTCLKCQHNWKENATRLLLKVDHRDVKLDEVEKNLACPLQGCRHVGVRLALIHNNNTSGFVGGMP